METEISNCLEALQKKQLILYPTDTVWGLGCDATCEAAVSKIFELKKRASSKSLILLVSNIDMLKVYVPDVSSQILELIEESQKPTTVIYSNPIQLAKNAIADNQTVAIRIPKNEFCIQLIKRFGKPIVSTSANVSGEPTPKCFSEISSDILQGVSCVANIYRTQKNGKPSTILKVLEDGSIDIIRP